MKQTMFGSMLTLVCALLGACADAPDGAAPSDPVDESDYTNLAEDGGVLESHVQALSTDVDFCWKDSYGRGAGRIPDACPGQQEDAGLCYPYCAGGYSGVGPVCWQQCPAGYRDDGTACWIDSSIISANNSQCPWYDQCGLTFAQGCSTCPSGYRNDGCTCRRDVTMFYKATYGRGVGAPRSCNSSLQSDAGLCYNYCQPTYAGVGPVCWGQCPASAPVQCGAGCSVSSVACAEKVITQIQASVEMASNIASAVMSFGGSAAAKYLTKVGMTQAEKAALKQKIKQEIAERAYDLAEDKREEIAVATVTAAMGEEVDWASLDPTGIAAMVDAFDAPLCSKLESNRALGKPTSQSSTGCGGDSARAVDGNTNGQWSANSTTHTNSETGAWWQVNLQQSWKIGQVVIWNRQDCCTERLSNFNVEVRDASNRVISRKTISGTSGEKSVLEFGGVVGQIVVVQLNGANPLSLAEVQVMGY